MSFWLAAAIIFAIAGLVFFVTGLARRNPGGARLCPRCRYDLCASENSTCSECGYRWTDQAELLHRPTRHVRFFAGLVLLVTAFGFSVVAIQNARHWTYYVPDSVLTMLLDKSVEIPPRARGALLPTPNPDLKRSSDRWKRLVWQQQAALAMNQFLDRVGRSNGSIEDIERMVPMAREVHEIYQEQSLTRADDAWVADGVKQRAREQRDALDGQHDLPLGTWAASELQYFMGNSDTAYPDWIDPPLDIHVALSRSSDPAVRRYALERLTYLPDAMPIIERMAEQDPNPHIRTVAQDALIWQREFRGWP